MSDPKNKWTQPDAPPPPMFFGKNERDLVKQVNDELAERVVGQSVAELHSRKNRRLTLSQRRLC